MPTRPSPTATGRHNRDLHLRVRNILLMMLTEFLLGMAVNVIGPLDAGHRDPIRIGGLILLGLHEAVGVGLLIASIFILHYSSRLDAATVRYARYGAAGTLGALTAGLATITTPLHELCSFLMAALFALAVTAYVLLYTHAERQMPAPLP